MRGGGRARPAPDFSIEARWRARGARIIAGVDEAGRGPIAGPVVAAAVVLRGDSPPGVRDSKELTAARRAALYDAITAVADVAVAIAPVERIDRDNILAATLWAMGEAVAALAVPVDLALIDGNRPPRLACRLETVVGGDRVSASIAAASIIAKVTRDRLMDDLASAHPGYGFERHRGYPTKAHLVALGRLGPCPHHRRSFAPVARLLTGA